MSQSPPTRDLDCGGKVPMAAGARKEKSRLRSWKPGASQHSPRPYVELHAASAFSFLDGASLPEDLLDQAATLDLPAMALIDTNGVYGAPRFYGAAKKAGVRALVGAELVLEEGAHEKTPDIGMSGHRLRLIPHEIGRKHPIRPSRLTLLVASRTGYRNLCRLLTIGAMGRAKGDAVYRWEQIAEYSDGLHCLTGGAEGEVARLLTEQGADAARDRIAALHAIFNGRVHIELQRHRQRDEEHRNQALIEIASRLRIPLIATNGVRYARPEDKQLHDVLTCIREGTNLDAAGRLLGAHRERHIKNAAAMSELFADLPRALDATVELANTLDFTLADLGYRFPDYPLPPGETPASFLRQITWNSARARFRPLTAKAQLQLEKELAMIEKLDLAGYFLIVWDIVQFCQRENILVQGRGSAANSAVCYALSITAVDPVKMELLFERFLSEERGEWPDIDLDLPSGDQRERVIQHVYKTYGARGAAMTANVITYRDKSAAREVGKALGYSLDQVDKLSRQLTNWTFGEIRDKLDTVSVEFASAGFDMEDKRVRHLLELWMRIQNLPRHLGQHSGGMVMAGGHLDEVVPLEPASMPGRVVIQWDKDDCADLGLIKVDLLGLGMLAALEEAISIIRNHERIDVDLAHLPADDPLVYKMLNEADTIGMFQVESRAQMASLPRHKPRNFYDIVVQVAIIRPGPIVGGMIRPFFDRRQGKIPVEYPHPSLEPVLKRTLGVPLFQEQLLKIAMVAAGFTGGEAEELRRAMGFKRSMDRMVHIEERLRAGMTSNGISAEAQEQIVKSITSFALYGFPESHAASFALIAYASAYIKARHPAAFYVALLNAWPMGFYHPATLVKDAQRHGIAVHPIDVNHSDWMCRWEEGGVRLGLRYVKGLREKSGRAIERSRLEISLRDSSPEDAGHWNVRPHEGFRSVEDLARRCSLRDDQLTRLAHSGALASFGHTRRAAIWQADLAAKRGGPLFEEVESDPPKVQQRSTDERKPGAQSPLPEMSPYEETLADYRSMDLTAGPHLMEHSRRVLANRGVLSASDLQAIRDGQRVTTAGAVIVRQRPGTAKGFVFLTLEDETGMSQAIVSPTLFRENRSLIVGSPGLVVEGILQKDGAQCSLKAERFWALRNFGEIQSHDFH
ncbi:MAG TPA: error-prone DNA polymerase [Thermoanaerobaculia bacterium]|nr:error-prone DNA polymerase [Thermoanaerobaculia bacterium]